MLLIDPIGNFPTEQLLNENSNGMEAAEMERSSALRVAAPSAKSLSMGHCDGSN